MFFQPMQEELNVFFIIIVFELNIFFIIIVFELNVFFIIIVFFRLYLTSISTMKGDRKKRASMQLLHMLDQKSQRISQQISGW